MPAHPLLSPPPSSLSDADASARLLQPSGCIRVTEYIRHRSSSLVCGCTRPSGGEEMASDAAVQTPSIAPTYHSSRIPCRTAWVLVPSSSMCPRPLLLRVTLRANPLAGSRPKRVARASIASGLDLNFSVTSVEGQHATKNDARPGRPGIVPCFITTAQV